MAGTAETEAVAPAPAAPKRSNGSTLLLIAGLAGGSLGGVAGALLVAPRLTGGAATAPAPTTGTPATTPAPAAAPTPDTKSDKPIVAGKIYRVDNVIVNPAGSDGSRFVMASVVFQIPDDASEQTLRAHDVEIRDQVVGALESMTMAHLTGPHARDSIKVQLLGIARHFLSPQTSVDVFLPQFVIQ